MPGSTLGPRRVFKSVKKVLDAKKENTTRGFDGFRMMFLQIVIINAEKQKHKRGKSSKKSIRGVGVGREKVHPRQRYSNGRRKQTLQREHSKKKKLGYLERKESVK